MKRSLHTLLAFLICFPVSVIHAKESGKSLPSYSITSTSTDKTLKRDEALFVFTCYDITKKALTHPVKYSYNGTNATAQPDKEGKFSVKLKSGKYKWQFFINGNFEEIYTDSIPAKSKTRTEVRLNFKDATMMMIEDKPVIYLYPTKETNVSVKLDLKGEMLFTYPVYNNGWNVTANPDGTLKHKDQTYSYLFWEGKTEIKKSEINSTEGFIVTNENLLTFFEDKLKQMGLSSKEQQDFITYWVPRMNASKNNYIHFLFNEKFDNYAHLDVNPKPDNVFRVFMVWDSIEENMEIPVKEQVIPKINRTGFSVVEWGGSEVEFFTEENN